MIEQILLRHLVPLSGYIYGFADLHGLLDEEYQDYPYAISFGKKLDNAVVDTVVDRPTHEYYAHYRSINVEMSSISERICGDLGKVNIGCIGIFPTISSDSKDFEVYLERLRYKFSHKMAATRAGLGWIGKTDLFVSTEFGPRVRLATILIDQPVVPQHPVIDESHCGSCEVCVRQCPVQAATGALWDIHTDRDIFFDARKCREKCKEFGALLIDKNALVCGICVACCPRGRNTQG